MNPLQEPLVTLCRPLIKGATPAAVSKAVKRYQDIRSRILEPRLGELLDGLWAHLVLPPAERPGADRAEALARIAQLRERGLEGLAAISFQLDAGAFREDTASEVIKIAPSAEGLTAWLRDTQADTKAFVAALGSQPEAVYPSAALEWLVGEDSPEKLGPMLGRLLRDEARPPHRCPPAELVARVLEGDTKGIWLDAMLRLADETVPADLLARHFRRSPAVLDRVLRNLPNKVGEKSVGPTAKLVAEQLFNDLPLQSGQARRIGCAQLARFVAELLLMDLPVSQSRELIKSLSMVSRSLRMTAATEALKEATWVCECMGEELPTATEGIGINAFGARHLVQAMVNVGRGTNPTAVLDALACNIGLQRIEQLGARVSYDPKIHLDFEGGLLPGDPVSVVKTGWRFERETLLRAEVKPITQ
jgi:hypothetical protein